MSNKYQDELYEKMNAAFNKPTKENTRKEVIKLVPGNNYVVRIVPNLENPSNTFLRYYMHGWISADSGQYIATGCPTTYEEDCPICKEYFKLYNKGTDESKEVAKNIKRKSRIYANVFVVDDPTNPENNNTVKILSFGQQLDTVIEAAWSGDDKEEVGARMFDFSENGCNLRIKVEKNSGGFPVYTSSKFLNPSKITVELADILDQTHDIGALVKIKPTAELEEMIAVGLYGETPETTKPSKPVDDIPMNFETKSTTTTKVNTEVETEHAGDDVLDGLDAFLNENK